MQNHQKSLPVLFALMTISFVWGVSSSDVQAQAGKSIAGFDNICLTEARRAEAQHGIPNGLLQSISRVEAGRKTVTGEFMPWAWTLNDQGEGLFFDNREAAMRHLQDAVAAGDHSVDVGCMQVNTKWHMDGFHELGDMLDPVQNADYAAGFLLDLHEAHQSWDDAVKHYHSAKPEKNVIYHRRVLAELEMFLNSGPRDVATAPDPMGSGDPVTGSANDISSSAGDGLAGELALRKTATPVPLPADPTPVLPAPVLPASVLPAPVLAAPVSSPKIPSVPASPAMGPIEKQPNLAPHWDRVEHFRRLLSQGAG